MAKKIGEGLKRQMKETTSVLKDKGKASMQKYGDKLSKGILDIFSPSSVSKPKVTFGGKIKLTSAAKSKDKLKKDSFGDKGKYITYGIVAGLGLLIWNFLKRKK